MNASVAPESRGLVSKFEVNEIVLPNQKNGRGDRLLAELGFSVCRLPSEVLRGLELTSGPEIRMGLISSATSVATTLEAISTETILKEAAARGWKAPTLLQSLLFALEKKDLYLFRPIVFLHEPLGGLVTTLGSWYPYVTPNEMAKMQPRRAWYLNSPKGNWIIRFPVSGCTPQNWTFAFVVPARSQQPTGDSSKIGG